MLCRPFIFCDVQDCGLEPAFGAGDAGGVDPIGGAQLGNCLGEIVADGTFGEMKFVGDFGAAAAITCALENLTLTIGKGVEFCVPGFGGELGIDDTQTAMDATHGVGELLRRSVFEEITARARVHGATKISGPGKGSEDDGAGVGMTFAQAGCKFEAGHVRHLDVGDENVGSKAGDGGEGVTAIRGLGHDGDVWLEIKQGGESSQHHGLIFGERDADGLAHTTAQEAFSPG